MGCMVWDQLTWLCDTRSFGCNVELLGSRISCKITEVSGASACCQWGWAMAGPSRTQVGLGRCFPSSQGLMNMVPTMLLAGQ